MRSRLTVLVGMALLLSTQAEARCNWREPARTFPIDQGWQCSAIRWTDGDTLTARCDGINDPVRIRVRGVDTVERGDPQWSEARQELRRRTNGAPLTIEPHHLSHDRVVADVLVGGANVGQAMDVDGWSKAACPRR